MQVVRSTDHRLHFPTGELNGGQLVRPFECPERWDYVMATLADHGFTDLVDPDQSPTGEAALDATLAQIHSADYLEFLTGAWSAWTALGRTSDMIPTFFPARQGADVPGRPDHIDGQLGWYGFTCDTAITEGTWSAARAAAALALTAQRLVSSGQSSAFALCRPPGHHAGGGYFGGYCFLNNAGVAAQGFLNDGADRVAIVDVDFHHGNGTQDIFYGRDDVLFVSLHGDPVTEFPYFHGYATETGSGPGDGFNANYPLAAGTSFDEWSAALADGLAKVAAFGADALVVSLGVDTFADDPISSFTLGSDDFTAYGEMLGAAGLPTVYCMEGGYAVEQIGVNAVNVLEGHLSAS